MISFIEVVGIAIALSIDAMVVALCWSAAGRRVTWGHVLKFSLIFGGFQCLMPLAGWFAGGAFYGLISQWDHWLAFLLLAGVAVSMAKEAFGDDEDEAEKLTDDLPWTTMIVLAVATSLDALAMGFSFALASYPIVWPSVLIGVICAGLTAAAVTLGKGLSEAAARHAKKFSLVGALVLLLIGLRILWEHGVFA